MYILNLYLTENKKGYALDVSMFSQAGPKEKPLLRYQTSLKMDPQPVNNYDAYPQAVAELLLQAAARLHTAEYLCSHVDNPQCRLINVDKYTPPVQDAIPGS